MPQSDISQRAFRGAKHSLVQAVDGLDFTFLDMDEASKKTILAMGADIRVPRRGRSVLHGEGVNLKRLYHELDNHKDYNLSILHLKHYGLTDSLKPAVMDKLITKIGKATSIQVLYIQNFPDAMRDTQLTHLLEVLKNGNIWAINIGEASKVSRKGWERFANTLSETNITHMYASENTLLTKELKKKMMNVIRENRKKDKRHYSKSNKEVIEKVTHMWFNPCRSKKYLAQYRIDKSKGKAGFSEDTQTGKRETPASIIAKANIHESDDEACIVKSTNSNDSTCLMKKCNYPSVSRSTTFNTKKNLKRKVEQLSKELTSRPLGSLIKNDHAFEKFKVPNSNRESAKKELSLSCDQSHKNITSIREDIIQRPRSSKKSELELRYPSSNLLTDAQIRNLSFRQQLAYVTRQSRQEELKRRGHAIVNSSLSIYWQKDNVWRVGFIESFCENTGKHKLNFGMHLPNVQSISMDIDLSTVESKIV
eukprot:g16214.t1